MFHISLGWGRNFLLEVNSWPVDPSLSQFALLMSKRCEGKRWSIELHKKRHVTFQQQKTKIGYKNVRRVPKHDF